MILPHHFHPTNGVRPSDSMADAESLMGAGMDMRNADFKSAFCDRIRMQGSSCSRWEVK